jgi:hypothetical protein
MVFVDDGYIDFYGVLMCFVVSDSDKELSAMARELGQLPRVFGANQTHAYYVSNELAEVAVAKGAVRVTRRQLIEMLRTRSWVVPFTDDEQKQETRNASG